SKAHNLAPWEPYYSYQLGWNLGELAYKQQNPQRAKELQKASIDWFETAISTSPYREFGYSNLGWLLVNTDPEKAIRSFAQAAKLVPGKRGAYFALGYSLLRAGQIELSLQAMLAELLSNPALITSPIWQSEQLKNISPLLYSRLHASCEEFTNSAIPSSLKEYFYHIRGGLNWWQGNFAEAQIGLSQVSKSFLNTLSSVTTGGEAFKTRQSLQLLDNANLASDVIIIAWLKPELRSEAIHKALLLTATPGLSSPEDSLSSTEEEILQSMNASESFHKWLTGLSPTRQFRNQRLGFGVISRHIDGPIPQDFSPRLENLLFTQFFSSLIPSQPSHASLERILGPRRMSILKQIQERINIDEHN
ncbi:MAG: polymerase, partial [Bacteroidota bacterium]